MRLHFSSASTLALATAATLAFPLSALAEDFVIRGGQKIAASLQAPVEAAASTADTLVEPDQTYTHTASGGTDIESRGRLINQGNINILTIEGGTAVNNAGSSIFNGHINAGVMTNNGLLYGGSVAAGAKLISREGAKSRYLDSQGDVYNNGSIGNLVVNDGTFANDAKGTVNGLWQIGGETTNQGSIARLALKGGKATNSNVVNVATVSAGGTLINNETGKIDSLQNEGTTENSGKIVQVKTQAGVLTNSASGVIDNLEQTGGTVTNSGKILVTTIMAGTLTNNGLGTIGDVTVKTGILTNNGKIETAGIEADGNLTNNLGATIGTLNNAGTATNAGQLGAVTQTAGELTNSGTILGEALIKGGMLTNNKAIGSATIAAGATFVNNENGIVRSVTNSGLVSNGGAIQFVEQTIGVLINAAKGTISGLNQTGGATTNNGKIEQAVIEAGTLDNNENAILGQASLNSGTLVNSGKVTKLLVGKTGKFVNNETGSAVEVVSSGEGLNDGLIANLEVNDGTFKNTSIISKDAQINSGSLTSTGLIGGKLSIDGTALKQGVAYLSGTVNSGVVNGVNGAINMRGDLAGHGDFINNGVMGVNSATEITGFDTFNNGGTLYVKGGLNISGDVISSGKIGLNGDFQGFETLNAGGNLKLTSTSETSININSAGDHDRLTAGGDITLGGTLKVAASGDTFALKTTFETFTSTAGDVVGKFTNIIVTGTTKLFGAVEKTATGVVLALRNGKLLDTRLATLDLGENAEILKGLNYQGNDGAELFDALATLKEEDAPGLMGQIMGATTSAITNAGSNAADGFGNLMQKVATASGLRRSNDGVLAYEKAMAQEQAGKFEPVLRQGQGAVGFWVRGFGETGSSTNGGEATLGGVGAGVEVAAGQNLTVGASAGYSMARFGHGKSIEGNTSSFHGGGYVAFGATAPEATGFGLTASGSYSKHETDAKRTFKVGTLTKVADANYGGTTIAGEVMVRNGFTIGEKVPVTIAPIAGLKFAMDNDEGYTETGAGALNLTVSSSKRRSLVGVVGLQVASRIETESVVFTPHVAAMYQHEFLDTSSTTTRTLGSSAAPFTVKQGGGSRSSVALEAGLGMRFAGGIAVDVSAYGVISADEKRYGATATVKAGF